MRLAPRRANAGPAALFRTADALAHIGIVVAAVVMLGVRTLNRSGFCYSRVGWINDEEKLAFAVTANMSRPLTTEERAILANAYLQAHPGCCKVYRWSEMFGDGDEAVRAGLIPCPTYVMIKHHPYGEKLAISSCADGWALWESLPMPREWLK